MVSYGLAGSALFGLLALIAACGSRSGVLVEGPAGSAGGGGVDSGTHAGGGGGPAGGGPLPPGSYNVVLRDVEAKYEWDGHGGAWDGTGVPPFGPPASEGMRLRIDYRENGGTPEAVVTPRWGEHQAFAVSWEGNVMVLAGAVGVEPTWDLWTTFRLSPSDERADAASLRAIGVENPTDVAVTWTAHVTAQGDVSADASAPEIRNETRSIWGPPDALLPWDTVKLHAAEGVFLNLLNGFDTTITSSESGSLRAGFPLPMTWTAGAPDPAVDWAGATSLIGAPISWDPIPGSSIQVTAPAYAVTDLAGNRMASTFAASFKYLDVGETVEEYTFDGEAAPRPGGWGSVTYLGQKTGGDPRCGTGGCVELGPFDDNCDAPRMGIAGRLRARPGPLFVRYRVLSGDAPGGGDPNSKAISPMTALTIGLDGQSMERQLPSSKLHDLGGAAGELHWSSDDVSEDVYTPVGASGELGFVIHTGTRSPDDCVRQPAEQTRRAVIIDRIGF
jgi:hypothetical protein